MSLFHFLPGSRLFPSFDLPLKPLSSGVTDIDPWLWHNPSSIKTSIRRDLKPSFTRLVRVFSNCTQETISEIFLYTVIYPLLEIFYFIYTHLLTYTYIYFTYFILLYFTYWYIVRLLFRFPRHGSLWTKGILWSRVYKFL